MDEGVAAQKGEGKVGGLSLLDIRDRRHGSMSTTGKVGVRRNRDTR